MKIFKLSGVWYCVVLEVVTSVLNSHCLHLLGHVVQEEWLTRKMRMYCAPSEHWYLLSQQHIILSQKTWISINTTVRIWNAYAVALPCCAAKVLHCVFPIWFTQCGCVWFTLAMSCPCHALTFPFFSRHGVAHPSRDGLWATCPRSAYSGYHAEFQEGYYQQHSNLRIKWPVWNQTTFVMDEEKSGSSTLQKKMIC